MPTLHRFERVILAWTLIGLIAAGPLMALDSKKSVTSLLFAGIPQGTKTVTLNWSVTPAVLPDREWNCGNGHGGFIDMFSYTPDEWNVDLLDANTGATVAHQGGTTTVLTYSCPGDSAPMPTPSTSSMSIDVSAFTADGDAFFLVGTNHSGEVRTTTPGAPSAHFNCSQLGGPFTISAGIFVASSPPEFRFDLDPAQVIATPNPWNTPPSARVLTHKYGSADTYPSSYQIDRGDVHVRPRFRFPGTAKADGSGAALNVWFRVVDPPDTAPYVVQANDAHDNDNKDTFSGGKGMLMKPDCSDFSAQSTCAVLNGGVLATTSAPDGRDEVVLETTDRFAGDNYQILASFSAPGDDGKFPCEAQNPNTCAKSAPITAWKRIYLEKHRMFQHGSDLGEGSTTGDTFNVVDISPFREGQQVRFVHAPPAPRQLPSNQSQFYFDDGVIAKDGVVPFPDGAGGTIKLQAPLPAAHSYFARPQQSDAARPRIDQGDFVGIVTGDDRRDFLAANDDYVRPLFDAAFVDYASASGRVTDLPFVRQLQDFGQERDEVGVFSTRWFEGMGLMNYQHLMGISNTSDCASRFQPVRASTRASFGYGSTYACIPQILGRTGTASSVRLLGAITGHELSHQWHVDPKGLYSRSRAADNNEHDNLFRFDGSKLFCLMHYRYDDDQQNVLPEFQDGVAMFHYQKDASGLDSEYRWVRERCEPIPYHYPIPGADWWTVPPPSCN